MIRNISPRNGHAGFSLVELMIAIVLGALVVAGLINVLMANRQAYHLQEASNYNQQNMRFAMDRIGWSLRMADFFGGVKGSALTGSPAVTASGTCTAAWALASANGIYGYDGNATSGTGAFPLAGCVNDKNYISGSDILVVRYADADALPAPAGTSAGSGLNAGEIYVQAQTGGRGELFASSRPSDLPNSTEGVSTYPYEVEMYYLRPCSDPGTGGICSASSDGGNPIPTLMRLRLQTDGSLISEPVVEGVEQLQFEYGIRSSSTDPTPASYVSADKMSAADWSQVVAVRVGYVLRSATRDTRLPHPFDSGNGSDTSATSYATRLSSNCQYAISSAGSVDASKCLSFSGATDPTAGKPQQFTRTEMTSLVQIRNRLRL